MTKTVNLSPALGDASIRVEPAVQMGPDEWKAKAKLSRAKVAPETVMGIPMPTREAAEKSALDRAKQRCNDIVGAAARA